MDEAFEQGEPTPIPRATEACDTPHGLVIDYLPTALRM